MRSGLRRLPSSDWQQRPLPTARTASYAKLMPPRSEPQRLEPCVAFLLRTCNCLSTRRVPLGLVV